MEKRAENGLVCKLLYAGEKEFRRHYAGGGYTFEGVFLKDIMRMLRRKPNFDVYLRLGFFPAIVENRGRVFKTPVFVIYIESHYTIGEIREDDAIYVIVATCYDKKRAGNYLASVVSLAKGVSERLIHTFMEYEKIDGTIKKKLLNAIKSAFRDFRKDVADPVKSAILAFQVDMELDGISREIRLDGSQGDWESLEKNLLKSPFIAEKIYIYRSSDTVKHQEEITAEIIFNAIRSFFPRKGQLNPT